MNFINRCNLVGNFIGIYLFSIRFGLVLLWRSLLKKDIRNAKLALEHILFPMDPCTRYVEVPLVYELVRKYSNYNDRIFDLSSNKIIAFKLQHAGFANVVSSDYWRDYVANLATIKNYVCPDSTLQITVEDGLNLSLADNSLDLAYSLCVLDHFKDHCETKVIDEVMRVLKPGGLFVLTLPTAGKAFEIYHDNPAYSKDQDKEDSGKYFFCRYFDEDEISEFIATPRSMNYKLVDKYCSKYRNESLGGFLYLKFARSIFGLLLNPILPFLIALNIKINSAPASDSHERGVVVLVLQKE